MQPHLTRTLAIGLLLVAGPASADDRLLRAAREQDSAAVRTLIKQKGVDVNGAAADGATALLWAAQWDDLDSARALIAAGARVDAANDYGVTPLAMAATNASIAMTRLLLEAAASPNLAQPSGQTPLMIAARTGRSEVVQALLARGASVQARDTYRDQTALMWAIGEGHASVVEVLLAAGAPVNDASGTGFTPLMFAARNGDIRTMQLLVEQGARVNDTMKDGVSVLHVAVLRGKVEAAEWLLDHGADSNAMGPGYSPLHWACGTWETYHTKDNVQSDGEWANLAGLPVPLKLRLVKALLSKGADVNARLTKHPTKFGLSHNAWVVEGGTLEGATPFLLAAMGADTEVMRVLLASGADPLVTTTGNTTSLMLAAGISGLEEEQNVPHARRVPAAELCLDLGVPIDAQNSTGMTALHATAYIGVDPVTSLLVKRGANMAIKNKKGQTPRSMAEGVWYAGGLFTHDSTARILRDAGGPD